MSVDSKSLKSKVIVYEPYNRPFSILKDFLESNNLIGLKNSSGDFNKLFLQDNIDLGAVFVPFVPSLGAQKAIELIKEIHHSRPELPIIVRVEDLTASEISEIAPIVACVYHIDDLSPVCEALNEFLFNRFYPLPLVHGIQDITRHALESSFKDVEAHVSSPYLVHDRLIYGEAFSLIPLESPWCRGYMMLQTSDEDILNLITNKKTFINSDNSNFRSVNELMNEVTNLVWGGIKSRFFNSVEEISVNDVAMQVPIIVNHNHRFISFGSKEPQLCFHYELKDKNGEFANVSIFQKMVFNLSWNPEKMSQSEQLIDDIVDSGELELF